MATVIKDVFAWAGALLDKVVCACQGLAEDEGKDHLVLVVTLPDSASALAYMRAAEEIELMLENTSAIMVNMAEYKEGEPPPPDSDTPGAAGWYLVGVVRGPRRNQVPEGQHEAVKLNFFGECISILESYGLVEEPPVGVQ